MGRGFYRNNTQLRGTWYLLDVAPLARARGHTATGLQSAPRGQAGPNCRASGDSSPAVVRIVAASHYLFRTFSKAGDVFCLPTGQFRGLL